MFSNFIQNHKEKFYFIFRVSIGILFLCNGLMKFGLLGKTAQTAFSLTWYAGIIETTVGIFVLFGLFTSWFALLGALQMIAAYAVAHYPRGILPFANGGERAVLYFLAFLLIFAYGSGICSLDNKFCKKK